MPPIRCTSRSTSANKWAELLDDFLDDPKLTDKAWFRHEDIIETWRKADMVDGKPYGIPYDGETTVQIYRKDLYDAKGLKPAETLRRAGQQREGAARPDQPHVGLLRCAA